MNGSKGATAIEWMLTRMYVRNLIKRYLCLIAVLALLSGCGSVHVKAEASPYDAGCSDQCFIPCDKLQRWDGTADQAAVIIRSDGLSNQVCELRRQYCATCLDALKSAKVIK